jgi:cytochrome c peroxidase
VLLISSNAINSKANNSPDIKPKHKVLQQQLLPLPDAPALDKNKIKLGYQLFNDPALSGSRTLACSSCHILNQGGDDNKQFSLTDTGSPRTLNTPTLFNTTHNATFFWSGSSLSLEELVNGIMLSPKAMHADWSEVLIRLKNNKNYTDAFKASFDDGLTKKNIIEALTVFQKSLVTPNSRFDQYLKGNESALTEKERHGLSLFYSYGCTSCHQGRNIGGNMFQKFGLYRDYYKDTGKPYSKPDFGRFNNTGNERDKFFFRVPSLRNVALTAPYFHNGSVGTLDEAIFIMGSYQLGREIPSKDRSYIEAFLKTLNGHYDNSFFDEE